MLQDKILFFIYLTSFANISSRFASAMCFISVYRLFTYLLYAKYMDLSAGVTTYH